MIRLFRRKTDPRKRITILYWKLADLEIRLEKAQKAHSKVSDIYAELRRTRTEIMQLEGYGG